MGRVRFLIYPWFFFCFVGGLNQTSLGQNSNDATYDVQGQQKVTPNSWFAKKSLQNPDLEAIYHFSVNSYLMSAVVKSIP